MRKARERSRLKAKEVKVETEGALHSLQGDPGRRFLFYEIPEFGYHLAISAVPGIEVPDVEGFLKRLRDSLAPVRVQAFDAEGLAGSSHLFFAALFALKAFEQRTNVSRDLGLETLIIASCQRQIVKAIEMLGLRAGRENVAFLLLSDDPRALMAAASRLEDSYGDRLSPDFLEISPERMERLKRLFEVSDAQLSAEKEAKSPKEALKNLIIEKMSIHAGRR